jgi:hypothetical protein
VAAEFPGLDEAAVNQAIAKFTETARQQAAALPAPR